MSWQANIAICLTTFYLKPANEKEITGVIAAHYLPGRPMGIVSRSNDIQDSHGRTVIGMNQCMDATISLQRPVCLLYNMINIATTLLKCKSYNFPYLFCVFLVSIDNTTATEKMVYITVILLCLMYL